MARILVLCPFLFRPNNLCVISLFSLEGIFIVCIYLIQFFCCLGYSEPWFQLINACWLEFSLWLNTWCGFLLGCNCECVVRCKVSGSVLDLFRSDGEQLLQCDSMSERERCCIFVINRSSQTKLFSGKFPAKRFLNCRKPAGLFRLFLCLLLFWSMYVVFFAVVSWCCCLVFDYLCNCCPLQRHKAKLRLFKLSFSIVGAYVLCNRSCKDCSCRIYKQLCCFTYVDCGKLQFF